MKATFINYRTAGRAGRIVAAVAAAAGIACAVAGCNAEGPSSTAGNAPSAAVESAGEESKQWESPIKASDNTEETWSEEEYQEYMKKEDEIMQRYEEESHIKPEDIADPDIKKIAEDIEFNGYELLDLKTELKYIREEPDIFEFGSLMLDELRTKTLDLDGIFYSDSTRDYLSNFLAFKIDEESLKTYLDEIVKIHNVYDPDNQDLTAEDCFTEKAEDGIKVYTWNPQCFDFKVSYDPSNSLCEVYCKFSGGVG